MPRKSALLAPAFVATFVAVLLATCTTNRADPSPRAGPLSGGTLRLSLLSDVQHGFDPQKEYSGISWEYLRCCLLRTLLSYNGKPAEEGGSRLYPDLASTEPVVSTDGLEWTFSLKKGIRYAPPLEDLEITAPDIIRALEREACDKCAVGGYAFYYSVIAGFSAYSAGHAASISGLRTPDDFTLVVELTEPTGDLGYRFALPAAAPIPPVKAFALGTANGHDANYGRFLVASGPYMFDGSESLDFALPPADQVPVSGYLPGRSIVLVRNPSWVASSDDLRPAYADRIETTIGGTIGDLALKVDAGDIDLALGATPPANQVRDYLASPGLRDRVHSNTTDTVSYLEMNLATPPFDDIHVRIAMNYALDKAGMLLLQGGSVYGRIASHIIVDGLEDGLLASADPYATPGHSGSVELAKEEMARSKYDANHDGTCDLSDCEDVLTFIDSSDPYPKQLALIRQDLEPLGITLDPHALETSTMFARCGDPRSHWGLCTSTGWGKDYPDGVTFASPLFARDSIGPGSCCNDSMVSATPGMLEARGYAPISVPNADPQIEACLPQTGDARFRCWADLDMYIMTKVVPFVPYLFVNSVVVTSTRVTSYSFDQFGGLPALDRISIGNSSPSPPDA